MDRVAQLPCVAPMCCAWPVTLHHCGTHMGGGRDHMRVIPLCWEHHLGAEGIDGKKMSKRAWEAKYGSEEGLLEKVETMLGIP